MTDRDLSQAFVAAVDSVGRHLVRVENRATGVVWAPDLVVTVHHPLPEAEQFGVELPDARHVQATLVGRDPATDLAVLKLAGEKLEPARFVDASEARVGELLVAVGRSANGLRAALRLLASVGGEWQTRGGGRIERLLATDSAPQPGFAGGVLARADGSALGISTAALTRGTAIAIPAGTITRVVAALSAHGRVRQGYLGVSTLPVRLPSSIAAQSGQSTALLVTGVQPGGPAEAAGVLLGDALITLADQPTGEVRALRALLSDDRIGQVLAARVLRAGSLRELSITLGARP